MSTVWEWFIRLLGYWYLGSLIGEWGCTLWLKWRERRRRRDVILAELQRLGWYTVRQAERTLKGRPSGSSLGRKDLPQ